MPLNLLTYPGLAIFSDNPIPIHVEAGLFWQNYTVGPTWGYWIIFSGNVVPAGSKIVFEMHGQTITVDIVPTGAVPNDSGLQVFENTLMGGLTITTWLNTVFIPTVSQNYHLSKITFSVAGTYLFINAPYESFLDVTTDIPGASPALIGVGSPDVFEKNYNILIDIYVTQQGTSEIKVATLSAIPEKKTPWAAKFDLSNILSAYVERNVPNFNQTSISLADKQQAVVRVVFAEGYGVPALYQHKNEYSFIVIKGGVPFEYIEQAGLAYPLIASNHWLTWKPQTLTVSKKQQEYLYWYAIYNLLIPTPTITADVNGRIAFTDGTFMDVTYISGYVFNRFYQYVIPAGYELLGIGTFNPSKEVESWTVYLYAASIPGLVGTHILSPVQKYIIAQKCTYGRELFFLFGNSLGGFDTLRTTTNSSIGIKVSRAKFSGWPSWPVPPENGETKTMSVSAGKSIKVSTGFVSLEMIKYLHEFLVSDQIFHIEENKFLPIILRTDSIILYVNDSALYSLEFEFEYAFNSNSYANKNLQHP